MARASSSARDSMRRLDEGRFVTGIGAPVRMRVLGRLRTAIFASLVLAPLAFTGGDGPSPACSIPTGHRAVVAAVAIAPGGRRIATAGTEGGVVLREVDPRADSEMAGAPSCAANCLVFSPDGAILAAAFHDATVLLWDVASGRSLTTLKGHEGVVLCLAFSPDGTRLATGGADEAIRLWDVASGEMTSALRGHDRAVCGLRFAPDGRRLASGSADGVVQLWDVSGGGGRRMPGYCLHTASVRALAFSPDGMTLASGGTSGGVKLWDLATDEHRSAFPGDWTSIATIEFTADGRSLCAVSPSATVQRWELSDGRGQVIFRAPSRACTAVLSPDACLLLSVAEDAVARMWDLGPSLASGGP